MPTTSRTENLTSTHPTLGAREVTRWLDRWKQGENHALDQLTPLVLGDLRRLAAWLMTRQSPGHTLQPTALVNEAYLRLMKTEPPDWQNRAHFLSYMTTVMRHLLANHARDRGAARRGGGAAHVTLLEDVAPAGDGSDQIPRASSESSTHQAKLLDLEDALAELRRLDHRQAQIVELRFLAGLTVAETARALDVSPRTVKRDWHTARLWLLKALT